MANDQRLIYANAVMKEIERCFAPPKTLITVYEALSSIIKEAPTVDAVEVVHGRWIFKHNPITDPKGYFKRIVCSECNLHTGQVSNYCPQCGAKMDGVTE